MSFSDLALKSKTCPLCKQKRKKYKKNGRFHDRSQYCSNICRLYMSNRIIGESFEAYVRRNKKSKSKQFISFLEKYHLEMV